MLGDNLKLLRRARHLTLEELATSLSKEYPNTINFNKGKLSKWENNKEEPRLSSLRILADYFNLSIDELLSNKLSSPMPPNVSWDHIITIPLIGTIACGEPITAEQNVEEYIPTIDYNLPKGDLFYLKAQGDSMEPRIPNGSAVLCVAQPDVESGEIAAVLVNGDEEATLKRVLKMNGYVILEAINEDYAPYLITQDNPGRIIGKAIKVQSDL